MGYKIQQIEGIGPASAQKLGAVGIKSTSDLLKMCCDAKGRRSTAQKTGLSEKYLLNWTNKADLMRISGVGGEFSDLLEAAGVDTVKELGNRRADNLAFKMAEINKQKKLTRTVPSERQVAKWVAQARTMEAMVSH